MQTILVLEIFLDAAGAALAAEAGLLDAAEGRDLHRDEARVEADHAEFQRLGDPPDAAEVVGEEIGRETERVSLAMRDRLGLGLEAEERRHRAEGLLAAQSFMAASRRSAPSARRTVRRPGWSLAAGSDVARRRPARRRRARSTFARPRSLISGPIVDALLEAVADRSARTAAASRAAKAS